MDQPGACGFVLHGFKIATDEKMIVMMMSSDGF